MRNGYQRGGFMYSINDTVLYGTLGVCTVSDIVKKKFDETEMDYYLLRPVFDKNSTVLAPCNSDVTKQKMRSLLSKDEIMQLKDEVVNEPVKWVDDSMERRKQFSEILHSFDSKAILALARNIYFHKEELASKGKNLSSLDTRFLKEAEKVSFEEIAVVLGINKSEVLDFLVS